MTDLIPVSVITTIAFVIQTALLVVSVLLCRFFWTSEGPMVSPFMWLFATLSFHVLWHLAASVLDGLHYVPAAHDAGEMANQWLFLSHGPLTIALIYLFYRLSRDGVTHAAR